jgi:hypothetical protein
VTDFADYDTIGEAREWLRDQIVGTGAHCPICTQNVKVYHRQISVESAVVLIAAYRKRGRGPWRRRDVHNGSSGDYAKMRYWELIENLREVRDDGGPAGWWRITDRGEAWVRGEIGIPRYVYVFDNRRLRYDVDGEQDWTIRDVLAHGEQNYEQLWNDPGLSPPPI